MIYFSIKMNSSIIQEKQAKKRFLKISCTDWKNKLKSKSYFPVVKQPKHMFWNVPNDDKWKIQLI